MKGCVLTLRLSFLSSPDFILRLTQLILSFILCLCVAHGVCNSLSCTKTNYSLVSAEGQSFVLLVHSVLIITHFVLLILHLTGTTETRLSNFPWTKFEVVYCAVCGGLSVLTGIVEAWYAAGSKTEKEKYPHRSYWVGAAVLCLLVFVFATVEGLINLWRCSGEELKAKLRKKQLSSRQTVV